MAMAQTARFSLSILELPVKSLVDTSRRYRYAVAYEYIETNYRLTIDAPPEGRGTSGWISSALLYSPCYCTTP